MERVDVPEGLPDYEPFRVGDNYLLVDQYYEHDGVTYLEAEEHGSGALDEVPLFLLRVVDGKLEMMVDDEANPIWELIEELGDDD